MLILAAICLTALAPGVATVWLLRRHGWLRAVVAGVGATLSLPFLLLVSLIVFPPLGFLLGAGAAALAVHYYDDGRLWVATAWAALCFVAVTCSGWSL
ncbi:hypothetical protein ACIGMX_34660 [Streptomyces aquilus]|uniref:hypothetical protein n=1 Tax=Streptomyces aquilus TaxID=2548456 RepID=UPI0037D6F64B